jgi:hypothetical protein
MDLAEIEEKVNALGEIEELTPVEAMSRANEIVKAINKVAEVLVDVEDYETVEKLYEKAANTYLLAAKKVSKESRDSVAFPANYWSMLARQMKLMLRKPSAPRLKASPISKRVRFVGRSGLGTNIMPSLESGIDISKPTYETDLLYPKKEEYRDVQHSFMKAKLEMFTEKPELMKDEFEVYGILGQSKKSENVLKVEPPPLFNFPTAPEIELKDVALSQYAGRSVPLGVKSNMEPLPKPVKDVIHEQQDIYKGVLSLDTIGGQ